MSDSATTATETDANKVTEQVEDKGGQSGNYTPPATQADFDRIIAERVNRTKAQYADYDELKESAQRLAEIEEANKTEAQKQADENAALKAEVEKYQTRDQINAWKDEVSTETGVPAAALAGSTKEEIEAHAETLKPLIAQPNQPPADNTVPSIGNQPERPNGSVPIADQIAAAEKAGDKALVAALKAMQLGAPAQ